MISNGKSYPFAVKIQMDKIMCPVDWDLAEFEKMMITRLKKDEFEWKFYDELVKELEYKTRNKKATICIFEIYVR